jgi:ribose-phosphate pyrophosphokinase
MLFIAMKTAILYNKNSNVVSFAEKVYERIRPRSEEFELIGLEVKRFNNGELYVYCPENLRKKECFFIHDSSKDPCEWLTELLLVNDMLKRASASEVIDVLPHLFYSRQDRKDKPRVPISAKVIADLISLSANRVITTDLHATQIQGFYNIPLDALFTFHLAVKYLKEKHPEIIDNLVVVSPDVGGAHRARSFAKRLNVEIALIDKRREKAGEIAGMNVI